MGVARFQKSCHPCRISSSSSSIVGTKKERMNVVALVRCCCYVEVGIKEIEDCVADDSSVAELCAVDEA